MKKPILFIFAFIVLISCKGQVTNNKILQALVNDSEFCKHVIRCKDCDTIHVIDTLGYFKNTLDLDSKIMITKEFIHGIQYSQDSVALVKWRCSNLFITKITIGKNICRIEYFHTPTNGVGFIQFRYREGQLIKVKSQFGQL